MRKKCSGDRKTLLKFEAESREFAKFLRSLEQFIQTVKAKDRREGWTDARLAVGFCLGSGLFGSYNSD